MRMKVFEGEQGNLVGIEQKTVLKFPDLSVDAPANPQFHYSVKGNVLVTRLLSIA